MELNFVEMNEEIGKLLFIPVMYQNVLGITNVCHYSSNPWTQRNISLYKIETIARI